MAEEAPALKDDLHAWVTDMVNMATYGGDGLAFRKMAPVVSNGEKGTIVSSLAFEGWVFGWDDRPAIVQSGLWHIVLEPSWENRFRMY